MNKQSTEFQRAKDLCREGGIYIQKKSYSQALRYFEQAESIFVAVADASWLAFFFHQKFICYLQLDNNLDSLLAANQAIKNYKKANNKDGLIVFLISYIELWEKQKKPYSTLYYAKIVEGMKDENHKHSGFIYQKLAQLYKEQGFSLKSITYYNYALEYFTNKDNNRALCLLRIGIAYKDIFQVQKSLVVLQESVEIFFATKTNKYVILALEEIYKIYIQIGKVDKAQEIKNKIVVLGQKII